jgi:hypothetical protein
MKSPSKRLVITSITVFLLLILIAGGLTAVIDPYFLYHAPLESFAYPLNNERYQNYGIARNWDYNAVIAGTSMSENFKPSEFDALFGVKSVKLPFSGGSHLEINEELKFAYDHNDGIQCVIRNVDLFRAFDSKDSRDYPLEDYPTYLYDDNRLNDVSYIFNKEVFFKATVSVLFRTLRGGTTDSLDSYMNWNSAYTFGPSGIQNHYQRNLVEFTGNSSITDEEYERIRENITENILQLAADHPETTFYIYVSPYSIYFFDYINQMGELDRYQNAERYILSLLVGHPNIRVFAFYTEESVVCNPYNYRDVAHHSEGVNSQILQWLSEGHDELTEETYNDYCDAVWEFYHTYDYDSLFEEDGVTIAEPALN